MKELLKVLSLAFVISTAYSEETKAEVEAGKETMEAEHKDMAPEAKAEEKMEAKQEAHAAHVEHVNRKMANELSVRLNKDMGPWKGPMATIPMPACCAEHKTLPHQNASAHHHAHKDDMKAAPHADHKMDAKKDDMKAAEAAPETMGKAIETVNTEKTAAQH